MSRRNVTLSIASAAAVLALSMSVASQDRFPDGPGKVELVKVCSGCHEPDNVFAYSKTSAEWQETLESMKQVGTEGTPDEWRLIGEYLDAKVAVILINQAGADEIRRTMEVGTDVAAAVIERRRERGKFKTIDDLKNVPGLDAARLEARKARLFF